MMIELDAWPAQQLAGWIAQQEGAPAHEAASCLCHVRNQLQQHGRRWIAEVTGGSVPAADQVEQYMRRCWNCLEYHWRRVSANHLFPFATMIQRIEQGNVGNRRHQGNIFLDVVRAQALEFGDSTVIEKFETEYSPIVRSTAQRVAGDRGRDAVENFLAELILPRGDRPPRIASFQGRTSLASWLRAVVTNYCVSTLRRQMPQTNSPLPELVVTTDPALELDATPCEQLVRPLLMAAVTQLASEDRLLIKMLVLDGVSQKHLAELLSIHSGNLTRRRQRVTELIWQGVAEGIRISHNASQTKECLQLLLAGTQEQRQQLANMLAAGFRAECDDGLGGAAE